jgi:hypothetical protein
VRVLSQTVVFERSFHECLGIAHWVLCDPSKTATLLTLALNAACHNVVLPQTHHPIGSHIGSVDGNAEMLGRWNGFTP